MSKKVLTIAALILFTSAFVFTGCKGVDKKEPVKQEMPGTAMHGDSGNMSMGGTISQITSAESLYTCPMHPEVVSADADTPCPLCKMKLNKMTDEKVLELRSSIPKGCPMDPIVVKGDSETNNCPVCKMKLSNN
jgi:hypothetical protein